MAEILESPAKPPHLSEEQQLEIINEIKPELLTALNEESFLSDHITCDLMISLHTIPQLHLII